MTAALATVPKGPGAPTRLFLDVERSVTGRAWRDRLDERATARALAIAQRTAVPELLARVLAGRGVEPVLYAGWEAIDVAERTAGEPHGRPRIKLCSWEDLLAAGRAAASR
jgi:hypothetical protein